MFPMLRLSIFILCINLVSGSPACNTAKTCGECIGYASERCVWCSEDAHADERCQSESYYNNTKTWCKDAFVTNPKPNKTVRINKPFGSDYNDIKVQFRPQNIVIKARPGVPVNFTISYHPAKDYPLDVYYLMDNSDTMEKNKFDLINQAKEIYEELKRLTNNVRLGVGSFVEKPLYPYYDSRSNKPSYSFKNHLSLTEDIERFTNVIRNTPFGANYDNPEAGFDALMQAMTCLKEIGWRNDSRRIIVLCTDSTYHSAGDGKMLGIIKPNDMKCHLKDNLYSMATKLDYPSVSQINKVATDGMFKIIFAVKLKIHKNVYIDYTYLSKEILGAKYAELKEKSNIVGIIKEAYLDSIRSVELNANVPSSVELIVDQDCKSEPKRNCLLPATNATLDIDVTVEIKRCESKIPEITIRPVGLTDKLIIQVKSDCHCDCESVTGSPSALCSNAGFIQCGICKCDPFSSGQNCQCNKASDKDEIDVLEECKSNPRDTVLCSGRGTCICGSCKCDVGFSGRYCEFNDRNCPRANNKLCAGRGICSLGRCECETGWIGEDCSCPDHERDCIAPYSEEICSGNGICKCGNCICNKLQGKNETYTGIFCESCSDCPAEYCKKIEDYAYCNYVNNKTFCDEMPIYNKTTNTDVIFVNKTEFDSLEWQMATRCKKELDDGSFILFKYFHDSMSHRLNLIIQKEKEMPPVANIWATVGIAIASVILIGLLTVIAWKILMDIHDEREYKKFEEESRAAGYDVTLNVLYQEPAMNFTNPIYTNNQM